MINHVIIIEWYFNNKIKAFKVQIMVVPGLGQLNLDIFLMLRGKNSEILGRQIDKVMHLLNQNSLQLKLRETKSIC